VDHDASLGECGKSRPNRDSIHVQLNPLRVFIPNEHSSPHEGGYRKLQSKLQNTILVFLTAVLMKKFLSDVIFPSYGVSTVS
jgi:hypothetical protein